MASSSAEFFKKDSNTNGYALIGFDEVLEKLRANLKCYENIVNDILSNAKDINARTNDSNIQEQLEDYIKWIKTKSTLKIVSADISSNILKRTTLHDVKISSYGPDDKVFDNDAQIRNKIARGNCIMETYDANGKRNYDLIVFALRKFTGGLGDEDDVDRNSSDWKDYFLSDIATTKSIVSLQKANGEAAHLSCRYIDEKFVICSGSKNVHLLFRTMYDIDTYYNDTRYQVAKQVSISICKYLENLNKNLRNLLLSFLCHTQLTVIFEILQPNNQHVEDLSYLSEPLLKFITFTESKIYSDPKSLCAFPPHYAVEIAKAFELSSVNCTVINYDDVDNHIIKVREDTGYEGVVMYFLNDKMQTIGLLKKKTTWYIIIRAIREKIRSFMSPKLGLTVDKLEDNMIKRLRQIKSWIKFDEDYFTQWKRLAVNFAHWYDENLKKNKIQPDEFYTRFPALWTKYLKETKSNDRFEMNIDQVAIDKLRPIKKNNSSSSKLSSYKKPPSDDSDENFEAEEQEIDEDENSDEKKECEKSNEEIAAAAAAATASQPKLSKKQKRNLKKKLEQDNLNDDFENLALDDFVLK